MPNQDLNFTDQTPLVPKSFKPDVIDAGGGVRRTRQALANVAGTTVNPATSEDIITIFQKLDEILTDNKLRTIANGAMTEATGVLIKNALLAQNDFEETIFTSVNGSTVYFRRSLFSESNDSIIITWTDVDGNTISKPSNIVPLKANTNVDTNISYFDVTNNGTGYSLGNTVARIVVIDLATGIPSNTVYYNLNTSSVISSPTLGDFLLQEQNVKAAITSMQLPSTLGSKPTSASLSVVTSPGFTPVQTSVPVPAFVSSTGGTNATIVQVLPANANRTFLEIVNNGPADIELWFVSRPVDGNVNSTIKKGIVLLARGGGRIYDIRVPTSAIFATTTVDGALTVLEG